MAPREDQVGGEHSGNAALPLGPSWTTQEPEGGPEAQLFRLLSLCGQLALASADRTKAPGERGEALRAAQGLLPQIERAFAAWEQDAFYQARGVLTSALAIAVERAHCDVQAATCWLAATAAALPADARAGLRPAKPAGRPSSAAVVPPGKTSTG